MLISISRDGRPIGEWTEAEVRGFYQAGQLVGTDLYWHEGMSEWKPMRDLVKPPLPSPELQPSVPTTASPPTRTVSRKWGPLRILTGVMAYVAAFGLTKFYLGPDHELMTGIFYGGLAGFICGLVPMIVARKRGLPNQRYFLICGAGGAVAGLLLAVPLCIGLTIFVCLKKTDSNSELSTRQSNPLN